MCARWTQSADIVLHVVAEVVEPQFVVRAVGDIGGICDLALFVGQWMLNATDGKAQRPINFPHPLSIAASQIIIDGNNVNAFTFEGIEVGRKGRNQRFPFSGLHLGDSPLVQDHAANELYVKVPHVQRAFGDFPHGCKSFRKNVIQTSPIAVGKALTEFRRQLSPARNRCGAPSRVPAR